MTHQQDLTDEQRRALSDARETVSNAVDAALNQLAAAGIRQDDDITFPCTECDCPDFQGSMAKVYCGRKTCRHKPSEHL
ncbi:hypothetical protein HGA11_04700 [Mycolicibacterium septicum DSM 44393]|uniref:Uncharacterized protein n=1 Tax=Mycolicibacterium septicum DSM 44393 TaxID=1341646 RepID=A0A7X6RUD5_9MYCO|nr:DUF6422 family protein [Mycolicibacterium septicum]NKZ10269.1 hypothetical protein [Mycolicibacterium septicum DSM 44393]